ncbi:transcriptional regulator SPT3 [Spizellomyces punctatus DAOM BR117]|uniref:Transcription initiation protein SPT3 n=1 Tax=Spizellomyces punctatus (strain DAOM BR117) TaxID=645134 RepID=A0A0L0HIE9_SPIPD|nr:transcriptional regulator SPT3 [Spizellomyces punctatus DAOM BR117]KND01216.1 hypothetical protein SPPG_04307 [Spizellomyces punctatus DAOM BR117]|eukprot:XP_016609255.1 hypothetical protein SPPG_04307 [Spizellomyces punctatus DAOM BR117]
MSSKHSNHRQPLYQTEIQQMMYVFGEVTEPLEETTLLIEEIVRSQMIEIIVRAVQQAAKRNSRFLIAEDLIFLIRHDRQKVNTLRTFLTYKDAQKSAKKNPAPVEQIADDEGLDDSGGTGMVRKKIKFSWDIINHYSSVLEDDDDDIVDEDEQQAYEYQIARLKTADEVTRTMTKEEYMYYSECRQASFTYKKLARFRKWCEMGTYYENKPIAEVIDILGFLAYEMVSKLTETGLKIKKEWDERKMDEKEKAKRVQEKKNVGLFAKPTHEQKPLHPVHIHEAFRRLQKMSQPMSNFRGGLVRTNLALI